MKASALRWGWLAASHRVTLILLALLALLAVGGGASRADVQSLVILRPLAVLALGYAVWRVAPGDLRAVRVPLTLVIGLFALCVLQLVPLPADLWSSLAGRERFAAIYGRLGVPVPAHALSLYPALTMNSLLALLVPLAALLLSCQQPMDQRRQVLKGLLLIGAASALLGMLQLLGTPGGPLYLYRVTNIISPVGLFSNRNHQAMFLAAQIPLLACYLRLPPAKGANRTVRVGACAAFAVFLLPLLIATGSRAGAVLALVAIVLTTWLLPPAELKSLRVGTRRIDGRIILLAVIAMLVLLLWLTSGRLEVFSRAADLSLSDDLRLKSLATSRLMITEFAPWGTGFGSFADVYQIFEPIDLLSASYLNHAHNDLVEVLLEGGVPAAILLGAAAILGVVRGWRVLRAPASGGGDVRVMARAAAIVLALFLTASAADYPLRVPLVAALCAIMASWLWTPTPSRHRAKR